jgi:hypothetical protein
MTGAAAEVVALVLLAVVLACSCASGTATAADSDPKASVTMLRHDYAPRAVLLVGPAGVPRAESIPPPPEQPLE